MKHKNIVVRGLEDQIKDMFYLKQMNHREISEALDLTYSEVYRFLRDDKLKNFSDDKLEAIAMSDNFNALNVISYFFQSVHHAYKELAFTGLIAEMLREKIAEKIDQEGVESLTRGDNYELTRQWFEVSRKISKLVEGAQKHMDGYINLFSQVLDVQREVSYVKVVTEILRREDPELYRKLQRALDADPEAKRVLESLSREDVMLYWDATSNRIGRRELEEVN